MNLIQVQESLKGVADQKLLEMANNPTGMAPTYMVLSELKRRQELRKGMPMGDAGSKSVAEDYTNDGIRSLVANRDMGPPPQGHPQPAQQGFAQGGMVTFSGGGPSWLYGSDSEYGPPDPNAMTMPSGAYNPPATKINEWLNRIFNPAAATRYRQEVPLRDAAAGGDPAYDPSNLKPPPSAKDNYGPGWDAASNPVTDPRAQPPKAAPGGGQAGAPGGIGGMYGAGTTPPGDWKSILEQVKGTAKDNPYADLEERMKAVLPDYEYDKNMAAGSGLAKAGLALLADRSGNLGVAIGNAGMTGLNAYQKEMQDARAAQMQGISAEMKIREAGEAAKRGDTDLAFKLYTSGRQDYWEAQKLKLQAAQVGAAHSSPIERIAAQIRQGTPGMSYEESIRQATVATGGYKADNSHQLALVNAIPRLVATQEYQNLPDDKAKNEWLSQKLMLMQILGGSGMGFSDTPGGRVVKP